MKWSAGVPPAGPPPSRRRSNRIRVVRRIAVLLILAVACHREDKTSEAPPPPAAPAPVTTSAPPPPAPGASSYAQAVEWFGRTSGFRFELTEGKLHVKGTLQRTTPGTEVVKFDGTTGAWTGTARPAGIEWKGPQPAPPPEVIRVWQRATVFHDPQKREGAPQAEGNVHRFTDANTGSAYEVSVDAQNRLAIFTITPPENLRDAFPPVTMSITEPDRTVNIGTP